MGEMIQAQELRIGNLLNSGKGIYKVISVSHYKDSTDIITVANDGLVIPYPCIYKPIPITEEWLLKFKFEKSNRIDFGELKPCYVNFSFALMIRHNSYFIDWIGGNTEVKYIHQLQNIYFALTQKELTINE